MADGGHGNVCEELESWDVPVMINVVSMLSLRCAWLEDATGEYTIRASDSGPLRKLAAAEGTEAAGCLFDGSNSEGKEAGLSRLGGVRLMSLYFALS